jgi:hypothetical protein
LSKIKRDSGAMSAMLDGLPCPAAALSTPDITARDIGLPIGAKIKQTV